MLSIPKTILLIIALLLFTAFPVSADERLYFESLPDNLMLSNKRINAILQDNQGFIWFGTTGGIYRYDGHEAKTFNNNPWGSYFPLVYDIILTKDNILICGTGRGLIIYDNVKEEFSKFISAKYPQLENATILTLIEDSRGIIWIGTSVGLYTVDIDNESVEYISFSGYQTTWYENEIRSLAEDHEGNIWVGTGNGLFCYTFNEKRLVKHDFRVKFPEDPNNNLILSLIMDPVDEHVLWVGSETGLHRYEYKNGGNYKTYRRENTPGMLNNRIRCVDFMPDSSIVFGTDLGLYIINRETGGLNVYRHNIIDSKSIINDAVKGIYREKSGIVWFGTDYGVSYVNTERHPFYFTQVVLSNEGILNRPTINNLIKDGEGNIWLATLNGVLKVTEETNLAMNPERYYDGLTHSIVRTVYMDDYGILWAGTDNGLHYLEAGSKTFVKVELKDDPFVFRFTPSLVEDSKGNIWICSTNYGLCRITPHRLPNGKIKSYDYKLYSLTHPSYTDKSTTLQIKIDSNDNLWAITYSGVLFYYNAGSDTLEAVEIIQDDNSVNPVKGVNNLYVSGDDRLYLNTNKGFYRLEGKASGSLTGLDLGIYSSKRVVTMMEDSDSNIWLVTREGFIKYTPRTGAYDFFRVKNDFNMSNLVVRSSSRDKNGNIFLGGIGTYISFDPASITHREPGKEALAITRFIVNDKDLSPANLIGGKQKTGKSITLSESVKLNYSEDSFKIHFSLLDYEYPQGNSYMYMLEGYDKNWIFTTNGQNIAAYSNVPPGKYRFVLKASYNSTNFDDNIKTLDIVITEPWWGSWWASLIYAFLIIGSVYFFFRLFMAKINLRHELEYQKMEREKSEELNQHKLRFFTNISHEFRTSLTLILDPLDQALNRVEQQHLKNVLSIMKLNGDRLLRLVNQIMDFRKVEYGMMKPELSYGDIIPFLNNIYYFFSENASKYKIRYSFESKAEHLYTMFDRDKIEKLVYNLITNAFKYTPDNGEISISVDTATDSDSGKQLFTIMVKDNGVGIEKDEQQYIFNRFYQGRRKNIRPSYGTGIGLVLCKEFVELHGGRIELQSTPGIGSEFRITLPVIEAKEGEITAIPDEESENTDTGMAVRHGTNEKPVILIVEDDDEMSNYIAMNLKDEYRVFTARDGKEGWHMVMKHNPELIISDIMMPVMDGIELCAKVKTEFDNHVLFILLTAKNEEENVLEGFKHGADDYIVKPFKIRLLKVRMSKLIESKKLLQEHYKRLVLESPKNIVVESEDDRLIADIVTIIEDNIDDSELKIDTLCEKLDMPHYKLYRRLKSLTGQNVNEFIRTIRMKRAAQLFEDTNLNITEVMYRCGFMGQSYFSKCFLEQYSLTPTDYIARHRKKRKH